MRDNNVSEVTILCVQLYSNDLPVTLYSNVTHISKNHTVRKQDVGDLISKTELFSWFDFYE